MAKLMLNVRALNAWLITIIMIMLIFSAYYSISSQKKAGLLKITEEKPAQLHLTLIAAPDCEKCLGIDAIAAAARQLPGTEITETRLEPDSKEAKELTAKYSIARLPTAIITGETDKIQIPALEKKDNAYVLTMPPAPYYDIARQQTAGIVDVTLITDRSCGQCADMTRISIQMEQSGIATGTRTTFDISDSKGKELIRKYGITKVPTMLLSQDALEYDSIRRGWESIGTKEDDGTLVLRKVMPPYRDLETHKIIGLVTLTYVTDQSCTQCYNVSLQRILLERGLGIKIQKENTVDITTSAGKAIAEKYGITLVPTFLLDREAEAYEGLVQAWSQAGTRADDGTFVFTKVDLIKGAVYRDMSTGETRNTSTAG